MASEDVIARRYARGLAEHARDESCMDQVRRDVGLLADVVDAQTGQIRVPEFMEFLKSPVATPADKLAATEKIMKELGLGECVSSFVKVVLEHNRIAMLPRIIRAFTEIAGEITGEYSALVHTARPLSDSQLERLTRALSEAFGSPVALHQSVEPGLLAGAKVTVGDKTFDGSVLGRLHELKYRLIARGQSDLASMEEEERTDGNTVRKQTIQKTTRRFR